MTADLSRTPAQIADGKNVASTLLDDGKYTILSQYKRPNISEEEWNVRRHEQLNVSLKSSVN